jgi:hypothetical protein
VCLDIEGMKMERKNEFVLSFWPRHGGGWPIRQFGGSTIAKRNNALTLSFYLERTLSLLQHL